MTNHSMRCLERQDKATQHNRKTKQHNWLKSVIIHVCVCGGGGGGGGWVGVGVRTVVQV